MLLRYRDNRSWAQNSLTKARSDPSDPANLTALTMVVTRLPETPEGRAAADLILKEYLHDESVEMLLNHWCERSPNSLSRYFVPPITRARTHRSRPTQVFRWLAY